MNSERSDIDVKVSLDIEKRASGFDAEHRSIRVFLERQESGLMQATVQALGFEESDAGARAVAEALDLVALGIESALPDEDPEAEQDEAIIQELIKAGVDEHIARGDGLKTVKMFALASPEVEMHPQDPERGTATEQAMQRAVWAKPTVQSFETPQHVRDARAQRRAERKGFNPKPKGGQ